MNDAPITYEHLGRLLKNARLEKKLELQAVARELHIRPRYLEALEEGTLDALPGDAFIGGYLGRYASFLGLNANELLIVYRHLGAIPTRRILSIPASMRSEPHPSRSLVFITMVIAIIISAVWHQLRRDGLDVMALAFSPPKIVKVRAITKAPECMQRVVSAWPPCYYRTTTLPNARLLHKPVRNVMELEG